MQKCALLGAVAAFAAGIATMFVLSRMELFVENKTSVEVDSGNEKEFVSQWGSPDDPIGGTHLIIAANRHKDELKWVDMQPYAYTVMVKGLPKGTPNNFPINVGREPMSYLQFIVEHYDDLPPRMIFVHGHNQSWHRRDIVTALNVIDPMSYDYADFANLFMSFWTNYVTMMECWENSGAEQWFSSFAPLPDPVVQGRPKEFYEWLYNWLLVTNINDGTTGRCMEWWWHVIFGRPWQTYAADPTILCPSNPAACGLDFIYQWAP